jgi:hypothetical protein
MGNIYRDGVLFKAGLILRFYKGGICGGFNGVDANMGITYRPASMGFASKEPW